MSIVLIFLLKIGQVTCKCGHFKLLFLLGIMKATLRIGEIAALIGVSTMTLQRWDKAGKLSCFRTPGNHRRIKFIEVQRIVKDKE